MADANPTLDNTNNDEQNPKDAYISSAEDQRNMQEVQTLLQNMQDKFQTMSDQIINRIDEMSNRVEDLEKNISELMTQAGVEPEK